MSFTLRVKRYLPGSDQLVLLDKQLVRPSGVSGMHKEEMGLLCTDRRCTMTSSSCLSRHRVCVKVLEKVEKVEMG